MARTGEVATGAPRCNAGARRQPAGGGAQEVTMATTDVSTHTAAAQGALWGARARDWAELQEPAGAGLYPPVLDAAGVGQGTRLLDVGCGSGVAASIARERGAVVSALDAAAAAVEIARERLPGADIRVGDIEDLPYDDDAFDVVTGFNSFQYAGDPVRALREARRVTRPGGRVAIVTWGDPERCESASMLRSFGSLMPPPPPGAPGPFALSVPGALERLAEDAGLAPATSGDVRTTWAYPDHETALRAVLSAGPAVRVIEVAGEQAVREVTEQAIAPYRTAGGGYAIENEWRYVIATA
jgi:SAM-dependent methyltransferase